MKPMYEPVYNQAYACFSSLPRELQELLMSYIKFLIHREFSPTTLRGKNVGLSKFFIKFDVVHGLSISEITKKDIVSYVDWLSSLSLSTATINGYLSIVKGFFDYLVEEEFISSNPVLLRHFLKKDVYLPRPMSSEDVKVFLNNIEDLVYLSLFLLMLRCGLRVSEACHLRLRDINWEHKNLIVHNGKGKVDRCVYFSNEVEKILSLWIQKRVANSEYCFPSSQDPKRPIPYITVNKWMNQFLQEHGLSDKGYSLHTLRHTFATQLLNAGIPLYVLRDLMGHRCLDQTLMYAKVSNQTISQQYHQACAKIENSSVSLQSTEMSWLKKEIV